MYHLLLTQAEQICLAQEQLIEPAKAKRKEKNPQERKAKKKVCKTGEERKSVRIERFKWTEEAIQNLIDLRYEKVKMLKQAGQELSVKNLWLDVPLRLGLENKLTPDRACQKWNQLVKKYKDIQLKAESGTCSDEELAWPHCGRIRDILEEQWTFPKPPEDSEFDLVQMAWEERSLKHAKRPRSDMWCHFEKLNNKFARCKLCQRVFSHRSTVSNLKKHLLVKHLASYANLPRPQETEIEFENIGNENEDGNNESAKHSNSKIKRSAVWNYFSRLDDCYAECNVCKDTFSFKSSISNLLKHRRNMHPDFKTNFIPIRTFGKPYSRMVAPVNAKAPRMRPSIQGANARESSAENESVSTPFANALQAVQEQSSPGLKPSYLWNFFTIIDKNFAECNMCKYKLVYKSGMSNLAKHQRLKHPLTQLANSPRMSENPNEDDPLTLPEDHPTIHITDVQSADNKEKEQSSPSKKYSYIWNFFTDLDHSRAQCKVCKKLLSYRASASNLMKHRRLRHPHLPCFREERSKMVEDQQTPCRSKEGVKKRKTSKVWQFFKYVDDVYAMCRMCNKQLSHKYTSTNLLSHKNRMHPDMPLDYFAGEPKASDNEGSCASDSDYGPGFDPPDANDSSDDNQNVDFSTNINSIVEVQYHPPKPKIKRKKGEKWSSIWRLFDRVDEKFAECRECKKVFSHRSTNTNLLKHTRNKHPDLFSKFTNLRKDFDNCVNELFDEYFPPPKSPPPAAVSKKPPAVSPTSTAARVPRQEFVIAIGNNPQLHGYHNEPSYNHPIIFIHDDQHPNKTKVAPTAKVTPSTVSHNNSGYTPNYTSRSYSHVPASTFHTFEDNGHVPMAAPNSSGHTVIQDISGNNGHTIIQDISGNNGHTVIQDISGNNVQCSATALSTFQNNNCVSNTSGNNGQITNVVPNVPGNAGQVANIVPNVCGNTAVPANPVGSMVLPSDRLLSVVRESNQLLRGMQSAIQRQSDVLRRLAESIETMRASNQEKLPTG